MQHARIMILDVDPEGEIERVARGRWDVLRVPDIDAAVQVASRQPVFVVITHLRDSHEANLSRIARLRSVAPGVKVFVLGDSLDLDEIVHAINEYRVDRILSTPLDEGELVFHLDTAREQFEFHCLDFSGFRMGIAEQNRRVLCVDDDEDILNFYQEVLCPPVNDRLGEIFDRRMRRRGLAAAGPGGAPPSPRVSLPMLGLLPLDVTVANSGERAVKLVQEAIADGRPFSAGFFDMKMPGGIDGLETIRRIREIDPAMMCAVVTAYTDRTLTEIQQVFSEEAEWMYFNKPFTEVELQQAASNLVHGWNHRRRMESTEKFSSKLRYLFYKQRYMYSVLDVETLVKTVCLKTVFEVLGADGGALVLKDWSSRRCEIAAMDGLGDQGAELIQSIAAWG